MITIFVQVRMLVQEVFAAGPRLAVVRRTAIARRMEKYVRMTGV